MLPEYRMLRVGVDDCGRAENDAEIVVHDPVFILVHKHPAAERKPSNKVIFF